MRVVAFSLNAFSIGQFEMDFFFNAEVAAFQNLVRRHRAERLLDVLAGIDRDVALAIVQNPGLSDGEIASRVGVGKGAVFRKRSLHKIPSLFTLGVCEEPELYKLYRMYDDTLLDAGVCRVNLYGAERDRYLEIFNAKKRGKK